MRNEEKNYEFRIYNLGFISSLGVSFFVISGFAG